MVAGLLASWLTAALTGLYDRPAIYIWGNPLRIGYAIEEPFAFVNEAGDVVGEAFETARLVLGDRELIPVQVPFGELVLRLERGDIDLIASQMFVTSLRCRIVDFSDAATVVRRGLLVEASVDEDLNSYRDVADRPNLRLGVIGGGVSERDAMLAGVDPIRLRTYPDAPAAAMALRRTDIHVIGGSVGVLEELIQTLPGDYVVRELDPEESARPRMYGAYAFRKADTDLLEFFNTRLRDASLRSDRRDRLTSLGLEAVIPTEQDVQQARQECQ